MRSFLLSCCLLVGSFVCAQEIRVALQTEQKLSPIYMGKIQCQQGAFSSSYVTQMESILSYDFNYNGITAVVAKSSEKESLLSDIEVAWSAPSWKKWGVSYVIRQELVGNIFKTRCFEVHTGVVRTFADIELSGQLSSDRVKLHKLSDAIYKTLFNEEGVASSRLLFAYQVKGSGHSSGWISEIWECDWDGANPRQVTFENSYSVTPVFMNSDQFLYVSYKLGQPKIYVGSLSRKGEGKRLVDLRGNQLLPALSSKKDKLAFISDAAGRTDLFLQPLQKGGSEVQKPSQLFSYPRSTQASPTFSPDGSTIAFVSDKDGGTRIYTLPAVASEKRGNAVMITKMNKENTCPAWSPDGKKLAYSARTGGIRQIWIYDFVLKEEVQLTTGPGHKENPSWAPDSRHIVFNSTDGDNSELYVVNLNQGEAVKITTGPGKKHYPAWGKR
ncbi:MAG: Protein TolB [Chlamydiota bacterium]